MGRRLQECRCRGVSNCHIVLAKPRHVDVTGDYAYVVVPVTLSCMVKGSRPQADAFFTVAFRKVGAVAARNRGIAGKPRDYGHMHHRHRPLEAEPPPGLLPGETNGRAYVTNASIFAYAQVMRYSLAAFGSSGAISCKGGASVRTTQRYLVLGLISAIAPIGFVATAPSAKADCTSSGYSTVCAQGEVRGQDGVPRAATPVVPYPCEYDWYCGNDWDLGIAWNPGRPGRPGGGGGIGPR